MLPELAELIEKTGNAEKIVLGNYSLDEGCYFKVDSEGNITDEIAVNKNSDRYTDVYNWFKERDYYSKLINMNKPVDKNKKIHSNNMYSIFIKTEILPDAGKEGKRISYDGLDKVFEDYFDRLNSKPEKEVKNILDRCNVPEIDIDKSNICRNALKKALKNAIEMISEREDKGKYLKLFIDEDISLYIEESKRYIMPKIFNDNKYNKYLDDKLIGLSNENMQLNSKKPFLQLYGTKFKAPYRVSLEQAIINKEVFEWMEGSKDNEGKPNMRFSLPYDYDFRTDPNNKNVGRGFYFETISDNGKRVIVESDCIPKETAFLKNAFEYRDVFDEKGKGGRYDYRYELENEISKVFFRKQMKTLYYDSEYNPKGCSSVLVNAMKIASMPMKNYFRLGIESNIGPLLDKLTLLIIKDAVRSGEYGYYDIRNKINLRINLIDYFKKEGEMNMGDIVKDTSRAVKAKILGTEEAFAENDREFCYCAGQLAYYIFSLRESAEKKMDVFTPLLDAKSAVRIKEILKDAGIAYSYKIDANSSRYRRLARMVMGYETDKRPDADMIICGICDDNIIYSKKEKEEKEEKL